MVVLGRQNGHSIRRRGNGKGGKKRERWGYTIIAVLAILIVLVFILRPLGMGV